ncbi:MAG: PAS domain S-box protein [candidate division NC10 bacterium]
MPDATGLIRLRRLSALSLPLFLAVIGGLALAGDRPSFPAPTLIALLNTIFMASAPVLVACLAAVGYLSGGGSGLLCLGCGTLMMGGAMFLGSWINTFPSNLNTAIAVHNTGVLAGALLYLIGLAFGASEAEGGVGRRSAILSLAYLGVLAFLLGLAGLGLHGLLPTFFTREAGPTPIRQAVLGFAILGFATAAALLWRWHVQSREEFHYWYGLALALTATGLAGFFLQRDVGDLLAWAARLAQYLGSLAFVAAAWLAVQAARHARLSVGDIVSGLLRDPARRLGMVLDTVPDAIFAFDREGRIRLWNPAAERIIGWSAAEAMGKCLADLLGPGADTDRWWAERADPVPGIPGIYEIQVQRRDGGVFPAEASVSVRLTAGDAIGLCVLRDITERKQSAERLQHLNRTLRTISDCNQALVRVTDEATLLTEICRVLVGAGGYRMAWVGLAEQDEAKGVRPAAHAGHEAGYLETVRITWADTERGRGTTGTAIRTGAVECCGDIRTEDRFQP